LGNSFLKRLAEFFTVLRLQPAFVIRIDREAAFLDGGQVDPVFLRGCSEIAALYQLQGGLVLGLSRPGRIQLQFREIPEGCQQNFRNLWASL